MPHSGFNIILFDLEAGQMRHAHFAWDGSLYAPSAEQVVRNYLYTLPGDTKL
jgi:hypothetical protein